jgi:anion-transporting  ArsA/GET3 family ATPase
MGKGGVGRSSVALALALALASRRRRVLLVQVHAPDVVGPLFGTSVGYDMKELRPGLVAVNVDPENALREYVMLVVRFRKVFDALFGNKLVRYFLRFIPSLAEINMLGKVTYHADEVAAGGRRRFEHVVVDAPATGHGLTFLKVARVVTSTAPAGPLRDQTRAMAEVVEDRDRTVVHVVTTPDEMSVLETEELLARMRDEAVAPLGAVVLNRVSEPLCEGLDVDTLMRVAQVPALRPFVAVAEERHAHQDGARRAAQRLAATGLPLVRLAECPTEDFTLAESERMGEALLAPAGGTGVAL